MQGLPHFDDPNLLIGAEHFSDAGVYRLNEQQAIVQSVDFFPPVVDDAYVFGRIAGANALGDLYAMGATPKTALNIVGFPDEKVDLEILSEILRGGADAIVEAGAVVVGGHSVRDEEIKYGMAVTGLVNPARMLTNSAAKPGDALVLTKPIGTGFITTAIRGGKCPKAIEDAARLSMMMLNRTASETAVEVGASAATDVTGFGLAGHAMELAEASGVTIALQLDAIPLLPGVEELAARRANRTRANASNRAYVEVKWRVDGADDAIRLEALFDPQTSGGLLVALSADAADRYIERCRSAGIDAIAVIGRVREREDDLALIVES